MDTDNEMVMPRPLIGIGVQAVPVDRTEYRQGSRALFYVDHRAATSRPEVVMEGYNPGYTRRQWLGILSGLLTHAVAVGEVDAGWTLDDLHHWLDMRMCEAGEREPPSPF